MGRDGLKIVVEYHMELRRYTPCSQVEDQRDLMGMLWTVTDMDKTAPSGTPPRNFLPVLESGVQDVGGAAPNVQVMVLGTWPDGASEQLVGALTTGLLRQMVQEVNCMKDGKGPQSRVGDIGPVNCLVMHHGSGN